MQAKEKTQVSPGKQTKSPAGKMPWAIFLACVCLLAVAGLSWWQYQLHTIQQMQSQALSKVTQQIADEMNQLQYQLQQLDRNAEQDDKWQVAYVTYLLKQANLQRELNAEPALILALLKQAQQSLLEMHLAKFQQTQKVLLKQIAAYESLSVIEPEQIILRLQSLGVQVDKLPLAKGFVQAKTSQQTEVQPKYIQALRELVTIRRHDQAVQPLLSEQQQWMLRQAIQFQLQQAAWAVMQRHAQLYQASLEEVKRKLSRYFETQAQPTQALLTQLQDLLAAAIQPELPEVNNILVVLQQELS
jgi:uroporphyrin-3 C-methyltransferase